MRPLMTPNVVAVTANAWVRRHGSPSTSTTASTSATGRHTTSVRKTVSPRATATSTDTSTQSRHPGPGGAGPAARPTSWWTARGITHPA